MGPWEWNWWTHERSPKVIFLKLENSSPQSSQKFWKLWAVAPANISKAFLLFVELSLEMMGSPHILNFQTTKKVQKNAPRQQNRKFTIDFRLPFIGHYCIALTNHVFTKYVRGWIGSISNCCIIHAPLWKVNDFRLTQSSGGRSLMSVM